jgi:Phage integrase, N-terminal SAM-like domain
VKETIGRKSQGRTKRKVQAELAERIANVAKRGYVRPQPMLFSRYADDWFTQAQVHRRWDTSTMKKYRKAVERSKDRFGHMKLSEVRRPHINAWSAELLKEVGPAVVNLTLTVLKMILTSATEDELIQSNPAERIQRPKIPPHKPRRLTTAEARAVEAELKTHRFGSPSACSRTWVYAGRSCKRFAGVT